MEGKLLTMKLHLMTWHFTECLCYNQCIPYQECKAKDQSCDWICFVKSLRMIRIGQFCPVQNKGHGFKCQMIFPGLGRAGDNTLFPLACQMEMPVSVSLSVLLCPGPKIHSRRGKCPEKSPIQYSMDIGCANIHCYITIVYKSVRKAGVFRSSITIQN